jgi:pilus assembly protein Flp/PilA
MMKRFFAKMSDEKGQGLVEYALILVLVAIVVIGVLTTMGTSVQAVFQQIVDAL